MTLTPLIEPDEIRKAYETFAKSMRKGGISHTTNLGWQGDNTKAVVFWHETLGIWSCFDPEMEDNRYWCAFGIQDASKLTSLDITCEINTPKEGINRQIAGLFVRDNDGNVYLTHNGNLRGGRKGISGTTFRKYFQSDQFVNLAWQDGVESKNILIGRLEDPELPYQVNHFVKRAYRFKEQVVTSKLPKTIDLANSKFTPEFSGQRQSYYQADKIKSQCNHGRVIDALHNLLERKGLKTANDNYRDLFALDDTGIMTVLFEAKTDTSPSNIYSAIGQLMYHAEVQDPPPKRVLVIPQETTQETSNILNRLGIEVITYRWEKGNAAFSEIDSIFRETSF